MIGKTISHYKVLEKLGGGGMGVVYKAEDTKLKRPVALKFLPPEWTRDEDAKARFMHEAQAASALDHNNICTIYEVGETEDGQLFIAMALYEGETLKYKIERSPLKLDEAIELSMQIAQGLAKAHQKEIVHRDIKPANVFITNDGVAKILDFGLAKLAGRTMLTKEGTTLGTTAYMSPEQAHGTEVDHRTDIWSLGVVLFEMLTGQVPFKGDFEQSVVYSILNEEAEPVTGLRTGVPLELERIVTKALAKTPGERYPHAEDMSVDLGAIKKQIEIGKSRKLPGETKSPTRKPVYLYRGLAVLLALVVLLGIYFWPEQRTPIDSIAVLPLDNLSGDSEQDYFVDGMTEVLITELSKIRALGVTSRPSAMRYKNTDKSLPEIAEELKVGALVTGSALRIGNRVRITAQLIEAETDRHLWANSYERDFSDILALHREVALAITQEVKTQLTPQDEAFLSEARPVDPEAYDLYLRGRHFLNKRTAEALKTALEYFQQAKDRDPTYALAYAGIADCYVILPFYAGLSSKESFPKAQAAALQALQMDERLAEAHAALAMTYLLLDGNWVSAEKSFLRAIELNSNYATAYHWYGGVYLISLARFDEAIAEVKRALALDPLSLVINTSLGINYSFARNYDLAIEQLRKTIEMDQNFYLAHYFLGVSYIFKGQIFNGMEHLRQAMGLDNDPRILAAIGYAYGISGNREEAQKTLVRLEELSSTRVVSAYDFATIYAGLGDKEKAIQFLQRSLEQREWWLVWLRVFPFWDNLRDDARFVELLTKVGLDK
jgi:serine/threonine-protein kinase